MSINIQVQNMGHMSKSGMKSQVSPSEVCERQARETAPPDVMKAMKAVAYLVISGYAMPSDPRFNPGVCSVGLPEFLAVPRSAGDHSQYFPIPKSPLNNHFLFMKKQDEAHEPECSHVC